MDPLLALRDAIVSKKQVQLKDSNGEYVKVIGKADIIEIDGTDYGKDTATSFSDENEPYTLGSIFFAFDQKSVPHAEYFQECLSNNLKPVSLLQKKGLFGYLEGHKDEPIAQSAKRKLPEEAQDDIYNQQKKHKDSIHVALEERMLQDRKTILSSSTHKSFEGIQKIAVELILKSKKGAQKDRKTLPQSGKKSSGTPIIILPTSLNALMTMYNAREFLEKANFKTNEECRKSNDSKESELSIKKSFRGGSSVNFRVIDSPQQLSDSEWSNVIAVFVSGHKWQFKGWKWNEPVDLFAKTKGFFLKYSDSLTDSSVKQWNVSVLEINRYKRHLDAQCAHQFWTFLEQWIKKNRPDIL